MLCRCLNPQYEPRPQQHWRELKLHQPRQNRSGEAWARLLELVEVAAKDGREEFAPGRELGPELWREIFTLPATISKLTAVKRLYLYGSALVRIPPEIGDMTALEEFTPYTSYRLHWLPYEITRCQNLRQTTISTRALYGNYKFRPPFPRLPQLLKSLAPATCSVCNGEFRESGPLQYWVTRGYPLLVHACSLKCIESIPEPDLEYIEHIAGAHQGGLGLRQPETLYELRANEIRPDSCSACGERFGASGDQQGGHSFRVRVADGGSMLVYTCSDACSNALRPPVC
jgi:hypothetical protein